jgi:hypothetical protein
MKYFISFICIIFSAMVVHAQYDPHAYQRAEELKKQQDSYDRASKGTPGYGKSESNRKDNITSDKPTLATDLKLLYDEVGSFNYGLAWVKKNNKYGFINEDRQVVIPLDYDKVSDFHREARRDESSPYASPIMDNLAEVVLNGKTFKIDSKGNKIENKPVLHFSR